VARRGFEFSETASAAAAIQRLPRRHERHQKQPDYERAKPANQSGGMALVEWRQRDAVEKAGRSEVA
jgi:hypothetical protein